MLFALLLLAFFLHHHLAFFLPLFLLLPSDLASFGVTSCRRKCFLLVADTRSINFPVWGRGFVDSVGFTPPSGGSAPVRILLTINY